MRTLDWSRRALDDFKKAIEYIELESPRSADVVSDRILAAIDRLADFQTGHLGRVEGTYEKLVQKTPYIVAYEMSDQSIFILRVIHGARDWPDDGWPDDR